LSPEAVTTLARSRLHPRLLVVYLASPIDLVRDFIPVTGQLDDATRRDAQ